MSSSATPLPSLTQPQREAIYDLLLLGTYADSSLKISENERLHEIVSGLGWDGPLDPAEYSDTATARVRAASENDAATREFLAELSRRLETVEAKTFALAILPRLLEADQTFDASEQSFYTMAKAAFGV